MTRRILVALSLLAMLGLAALFAAPPAAAEPAIRWNPNRVEETLQPGQTRTIGTSFTALADVPSAILRVSTSVTPYVSVQPSSIGPVSKGQTVTVTLTVSVPIDALPATTTGAVQLRIAEPHGKKEFGKTIARPLPVAVCVEWPKATLENLHVSYPPTLDAIVHAEFRVVRFSVADPLHNGPRPQIAIEIEDNPNGLSLAEFFDGDPGADLSTEIASGAYAEITVGGRLAYRFGLPDVPAVLVVIPETGRFVTVTDAGAAFQSTGEFQGILNSLQGE